MNTPAKVDALRVVISAEQIQKRVREMGRQISDDYRGKTVHALAVLENSFIFIADLVRAFEIPVACTFLKPVYRKQQASGQSDVLEIMFSHELDIRDKEILLVEGLVHSGVTSEFLMNDLRARGAVSVKLATLSWQPYWTGSRPDESSCSLTISGFWWTTLFWWGTGWEGLNRRSATCLTWQPQTTLYL